MRYCGLLAAALVACITGAASGVDEYEQPPIEYSQSNPDNRVSRLIADLERGDVVLKTDKRFGYLPALLQELKISPTSQLLVFSKTSMQRDRISPRTPRALYFDDDVYVGYCHAGKVIELAASDPRLGAVFYTLDQTKREAPTIERQTHSCLQCHGSAQSDGVPGLLVRSVFVAPSGLPILSEGSQRIDHTSPIKDRWGGWYVTGRHGSQTHLGNFVVRDRSAPRPWGSDADRNISDLSDRVKTDNYLIPGSDIAALMVFEHQAYVHNLLTKANFAAQQAMYYQAGMNRALGQPIETPLESTARRIESAGEKLVAGLLFVDEAVITETISGSEGFADEFSSRGPRDSRSRSLRDFDLNTRLFRYPCSYLIYSPSFDGLHPEMKAYASRRLREILEGRNDAGFEHLSVTDRRAIAGILRETKPSLWDDLKSGEN